MMLSFAVSSRQSDQIPRFTRMQAAPLATRRGGARWQVRRVWGGVGALALFALAVLWAPLDRALGKTERRRITRERSAWTLPPEPIDAPVRPRVMARPASLTPQRLAA